MLYVVAMKINITTPTSIKSINTKVKFTSTAIPKNKKSKIHSTLNTIYNYFPTTCLRKKSKVSLMMNILKLTTSPFLTKIKPVTRNSKKSHNLQ